MSDLQLIIKYENDNTESKLFFQAGESLLLLCQKADIPISLNCGGKGICGKCKVRFLKGAPMPGATERRWLSPDELRMGYRLACLVKLNADCEILLPRQKEMDAVGETWNIYWKAESQTERSCFVTTDIGTTTVVMEKRRISDGSVIDVYKAVNAQKCYGADVISRMEASMNGNREDLSYLIKEQIQEGFATLGTDDISFMVVAANTTMVHLLMGYDVSSLSKAPFIPKTLDEIKTDIAGIPTYIMPGFSAFVGGDIFSGLLALGMKDADLTSDRPFERSRDKLILLLDLGTNAEMALIRDNRLVATSAAAGSAFDSIADVGIYGADIISFLYRLLQEKKIDDHGTLQGEWFEQGVPYVVDADKILNSDMNSDSNPGNERDAAVKSDVNPGNERDAAVKSDVNLGNERDVAVKPDVENGRDTDAVYITQDHIRQMQLAKAAVRCGIDYLVEKFGCTMQEIDHVYLAGGFGYYLDVEAAFGVGLLPDAFKGKTTACGNTALSGAALYGYSKIKRNSSNETDDMIDERINCQMESIIDADNRTNKKEEEKTDKEIDDASGKGIVDEKEKKMNDIIKSYVNLDKTLINLANEPDFSERYISYLDFET